MALSSKPKLTPLQRASALVDQYSRRPPGSASDHRGWLVTAIAGAIGEAVAAARIPDPGRLRPPLQAVDAIGGTAEELNARRRL